MTKPEVAVIIAAYNAEKTIKRAIDSALVEPEVTEIIVVDDCSTDKTVEVARSCDDGAGRVRVFVQDKNGGPSAARNKALQNSTAPWVTVLDSDDFFVKGRMAGLLSFAGDADFVADDMYQVPENDVNGTRKLLLGGAVTLPKSVSFSEFVLSNVTDKHRQRAELGFIKPLMRREFLDRFSIRYIENMRLGEDYELYARALGRGARMVLVPAQGYVSVVRENSLSGNHSEHDLLQLRECDDGLLRDLTLSHDEKNAVRRHYLDIDCRLQWRNLILAVKNRNLPAVVKAFARPFPVPLYLLGQLWEQVQIRILKVKNT